MLTSLTTTGRVGAASSRDAESLLKGGMHCLACPAPQDGVPCDTGRRPRSHTPSLLRPSASSVLADAARDAGAHSRDAEATAAMMAMHEPGKAGCREPATENPQVLFSHEQSKSCSVCRVRNCRVPVVVGSCGAGHVWPNSQNRSKMAVYWISVTDTKTQFSPDM